MLAVIRSSGEEMNSAVVNGYGEEEGRNSGKLVLFVLCCVSLDMYIEKRKKMEKVDIDMRKREDDQKCKKLGRC